VPAVRDGEGRLVPDRRAPSFQVPEWVTLPEFLKPHLDARNNTTTGDLPYRIEKALHFSNGGGVYTGTDTRDGRRVVLKEGRPHAGLASDGADAVARLEREKRALEQVAGTGVVPEVRDWFELGGHRFLVMDFLEGRPLNSFFAERHPLLAQDPEPEAVAAYTAWALRIHRRVEEAVAAVHARGIVFNDLHVFNIMVAPDEESVFLLDFEAAAPVGENGRQVVAHPGFFAPPDRRGADVDRYALACLRLALFLPVTTLFVVDRGKAAHLAEVIAEQFPDVPREFLDEAVAGGVRPYGGRSLLSGGPRRLAEQPRLDGQGDPRLGHAGARRPALPGRRRPVLRRRRARDRPRRRRGALRTGRDRRRAVRGGRALAAGPDGAGPGRHTARPVRRAGGRRPGPGPARGTGSGRAAGTEDRETARVLRPLPGLSEAGHRMWRVQGRAAAQAVAVAPLLQLKAIGLGLASPSPDHVRAAAHTALAHDFVRRLPDGYDTPVADAPRSGGESQRLGLARAFAHGGRLLILDDALSSLDTVTERHITDALLSDGPGTTRLLVAHRSATAACADAVAWLDEGRVRAVGRHEELWRLAEYRASTPRETTRAWARRTGHQGAWGRTRGARTPGRASTSAAWGAAVGVREHLQRDPWICDRR
jgi:serine/threonine protein kinase